MVARVHGLHSAVGLIHRVGVRASRTGTVITFVDHECAVVTHNGQRRAVIGRVGAETFGIARAQTGDRLGVTRVGIGVVAQQIASWRTVSVVGGVVQP